MKSTVRLSALTLSTSALVGCALAQQNSVSSTDKTAKLLGGPSVVGIPQTAPAPAKKDAQGQAIPQTWTSPSGRQMSLVFSDEFDALADKDGKPYLDRSKWQTTFWQGSSQRTLWGNAEAQYYTDKDYTGDTKILPEKNGVLDPFSFDQPGVLTISARKTPEELWKKYWMGKERPFNSGLLISDKRFNFQYGYMEGRFKLPKERGAWPAFWLLGNDPTKGMDAEAHEWGPEVDIFEFFGHRPTKHSAGIIGRKGEKLDFKFGYNEVGVDISQDFHTWGLEWDAEKMTFYFDGKPWKSGKTPESFQRPMYLLVNLAVGGTWYSQEMKAQGISAKAWEVDEGTMPWKMECDYVRVYRSPELDAQVTKIRAQQRERDNRLTREIWTDVHGSEVSKIPLSKTPKFVSYVPTFETGTNIGIIYAQRLRGFLTPPTTGDYTFWIAGNDNAELRLSPDEDPAKAVKIASVTDPKDFPKPREWNKFPEQKSVAITLEAGKKYYIEALHKQHVGGDHLSVGWLKPGETGDKPSEVIPSSALSPFVP